MIMNQTNEMLWDACHRWWVLTHGNYTHTNLGSFANIPIWTYPYDNGRSHNNELIISINLAHYHKTNGQTGKGKYSISQTTKTNTWLQFQWLGIIYILWVQKHMNVHMNICYICIHFLPSYSHATYLCGWQLSVCEQSNFEHTDRN